MVQNQEQEINRIKKDNPEAVIVKLKDGMLTKQIRECSNNNYNITDTEVVLGGLSYKVKDEDVFFVSDDKRIYEVNLYNHIKEKFCLENGSDMRVRDNILDSDGILTVNNSGLKNVQEFNFEDQNLALYITAKNVTEEQQKVVVFKNVGQVREAVKKYKTEQEHCDKMQAKAKILKSSKNK
jgi:hypothetical protein